MILLMQTRVRDYDAWKTRFDDSEAIRARHGCTGHEICRSADDGNAVTVHLRFPSREGGDARRTDPELAENMKRAGVDGPPSVAWAQDGEARTYASRRAAWPDRPSTERAEGRWIRPRRALHRPPWSVQPRGEATHLHPSAEVKQ